jgi:glycogen operon protein
MGDEVRRTQKGNNNAFCQNNEISWFDWDLTAKNADILRFVKKLVKFIQTYDLFRQERFLETTGRSDNAGIVYHGVKLAKPELTTGSHALAFSLRNPATGEYIHVLCNAHWEGFTFELPGPPSGRNWKRIIDTNLTTPEDIRDAKAAVQIDAASYYVHPRSTVVLAAVNF